MKYGKMRNGKPFPFFGVLVKDGKFNRNPTEADILAAGYLPIEENAEPESKDGFIKSSKWGRLTQRLSESGLSSVICVLCHRAKSVKS